MSTKNNSILKDMKQALINAHNTNNVKAISKDFAAGSGVSEKAYTSWVTWIESLHYVVTPWVEKFNDKNIKDEELQEIYKAVFPILRQLTKVDDKLFVRDSDAVKFCGFAAKHGKSGNGTVDVLVGKTAFRREIEAELGIRIAQNEVLSEDNYDVIIKYEKAVSNQEKAENRLNGYERNGAKVEGLKEQLKKAEDDVAKITALTIEMGADKKTVSSSPIIAGYVKVVDDLKSDITNTEKRIEKAKETIKKLGKQYKEIMAKISEIK